MPRFRGSKTIRQAALLRDRGLCCNCSQPADQVHHVVPTCLGGQDILSNMVATCGACHSVIHGSDLVGHGLRSRVGTLASIEHRRATGGDLGGRPLAYTDEQAAQVRRLALEGMSVAAIARATGLSESTTRRLAKQEVTK